MNLSARHISSSPSPLAILSLPVLPGCTSLHHPEALCQSVPTGFWPAASLSHRRFTGLWKKQGWRTPPELPPGQLWPRRLLTFLMFDREAPEQLTLRARSGSQGAFPGAPGVTGVTGWNLEVREEPLIQKASGNLTHYCRDTGALLLQHENREIELQFGFEGETRLALWQWTNAQRLWSGPVAEAWQVGGLIYAGREDRPLTNQEAAEWYKSEFVQEQTIMVKLFVLLFANGCAEIRAHFINNELYGHGGFVSGKPCILLKSSAGVATSKETPQSSWRLHPEQMTRFGGSNPAAFRQRDGTLVWQPFSSTEQLLGMCHNKATQSDTLTVAPDSEKGFASGVSRTALFHLTTGEAVLPARYLGTPEHYLSHAELSIPLELSDSCPAFESLPELSRTAAEVYLRNEMKEGFCSGGTFRYLDHYPNGRWEFSCDGNETAALFRGSYLLSNGPLYELALRNADFAADLGAHHGSFHWHYHQPVPDQQTWSLIYMRFGGLVHAYLETGDPYYLETAEAVGNRWIATHRTNWPRRGIGRDTEPVEGILLLYDFTGKDHYYQAARQIALDVVTSLYPDGMWRSGAGAGPYWGVNALLGSPWNGSHLLAGLVEFLLRCDANEPTLPQLLEGGRRLLQTMLSLLQEMNHFHRATCAFAWRRQYFLAQCLQDPVIEEELERVLQTTVSKFLEEKDRFFLAGHHCAPYIDNPWFFLAMHSSRATAAPEVETLEPALQK